MDNNAELHYDVVVFLKEFLSATLAPRGTWMEVMVAYLLELFYSEALSSNIL